ncbi:MAG: alpha/beta fold hydrolase, partial [Streptomyces sp.]|uniref:alpha/beta fold hydrolase n=1 Tax=Streptomyces sp. TaxID=1931 RepID=UPI003D6C2F88
MAEYAEYADTKVGPVRLAYHSAGDGGTPIVFVHGASCDRSYFAPQFTHFARSHAVAALDLRGHGDSTRPDPAVPGAYDVAAFADDTFAVAAAAGFDRPVVIGHSLGGLVALACAARPDAVRAAVLVDPAPILNERHKAFFARTAEDIAADTNGDWRRGYIGKLLPPSDTHRRAEIITGAGALPPAVAAATWRA